MRGGALDFVTKPFQAEELLVEVDNGHVALPTIPGVGFEAKANLWAVMQDLGD